MDQEKRWNFWGLCIFCEPYETVIGAVDHPATASYNPRVQTRGADRVSNGDHYSREYHIRPMLVGQSVLAFLLGLVVLVLELGGGVAEAPGKALASAYGVGLGILGTLIAVRSARRSGQAVRVAPRSAWVPMYIGLFNRLLVVGGGLALGMAVLGFGPFYCVLGYLISQLALAWSLTGQTGKIS